MKRDLDKVRGADGAGRGMKRRAFLAMPALLAAAPSTDARIDELTIAFEDFRYRAPYKFGGKEVDRVTMLNVKCRLSTKAGNSATGAASMSMGNVWCFPAPNVPYDVTLGAMKALAGEGGGDHAGVHASTRTRWM